MHYIDHYLRGFADHLHPLTFLFRSSLPRKQFISLSNRLSILSSSPPLPSSSWIVSLNTFLRPKSPSRTFASTSSNSKPISLPRVSNSQAAAFIYATIFLSYRLLPTTRPRAISQVPLKPHRLNPLSSMASPSNQRLNPPLCRTLMTPPHLPSGPYLFATDITP